MKKILNTFFFGYAAYKYRRLIRTLILVILSIMIYYGLYFASNNDTRLASDIFILSIILLFLSVLISFIIEPFIVKKPLEINKVESTKKTLVPKLNAKFITNKLISYFKYDGSYISGNRYWFRKILQWPLIFLLIGFYLRAVTTYYRCKSLKISTFGSLLFSIYSVFIDFYVILIIPFNEKSFGVVPEMQWIFILPTLPFAYLLFMNGKNNDTNDKAQKN